MFWAPPVYFLISFTVQYEYEYHLLVYFHVYNWEITTAISERFLSDGSSANTAECSAQPMSRLLVQDLKYCSLAVQ